MRFYNATEIDTPIEWYFTPDTMKETIPWPHIFGSRLYERGDEPQMPLGERYSPVPWQGGKAPARAPNGGLCGTEDQWLNGCSVSDPLPALWPNTTVPQCCNRPPDVAPGGFKVGGFSFELPCCPGAPLPGVVTMRTTVYSFYCPALDAEPLLLTHEPELFVPAINQVPAWISQTITFDPSWPTRYRFVVWCDPNLNIWQWLLVHENLIDYDQGATQFIDFTCAPFRLTDPHAFFYLIYPNCDIIDALIEIT